MKHLLSIAIAILVPTLTMQADEPLFPYPEAPESLQTMDQKCSYVIEHFWDRCNINQAFSSRTKLQQAFNDYVQIIPYANADIVHKSVDQLIEKVQKNPKNLLSLAEMAEGVMYSDTAHIICDEVYYPFAKAVAENKKIKAAEKARFVAHARILGGSQVGMTAPDFTYTTPEGTVKKFSELSPSYVILFFNDPDCADCMMARVSLAADYNINQFIKRGQLNIVSIYPGKPTDAEWIEGAKRLPDNWITGASADVDQLYDMRRQPAIYYLNTKHNILSKSMTVDQLINAFREINTRQNAAQ